MRFIVYSLNQAFLKSGSTFKQNITFVLWLGRFTPVLYKLFQNLQDN